MRWGRRLIISIIPLSKDLSSLGSSHFTYISLSFSSSFTSFHVSIFPHHHHQIPKHRMGAATTLSDGQNQFSRLSLSLSLSLSVGCFTGDLGSVTDFAPSLSLKRQTAAATRRPDDDAAAKAAGNGERRDCTHTQTECCEPISKNLSPPAEPGPRTHTRYLKPFFSFCCCCVVW